MHDRGSGVRFNANGQWRIAGKISSIFEVNHNARRMDCGERQAVARVLIFADRARGILPVPDAFGTLRVGNRAIPCARRRACR